jgi:exonuclease SbcD
MKILHTSDWHLGRRLYGRTRYQEFTAFLDWLAVHLEEHPVDALLIAGDIFDTVTPGNRSQQLYYRFLYRVAKALCAHVVVIGGNHDSPSFLNAPAELLKELRVHVVGAATGNIADEIIVPRNERGRAMAVICAVPHLRDQDIRTVSVGESMEEKGRKLAQGVADHYSKVCELAMAEQKKHGDIPIIAMGHLFASGGKTFADDGVRELYVGSLAHIGADSFPSCIDYLALGHLHVAQQIGGLPHCRYSGAPIPMGFGEAGKQKEVVEVSFSGCKPAINRVAVPCFQQLVKITGNIDTILDRIAELKRTDTSCWLEIEYTGSAAVANLREQVEDAVAESAMEIRRIQNKSMVERVLTSAVHGETLDDLKEQEVFIRCLDSHGIEEEKRPELIHAYSEILLSLHEDDINDR